MMSCWYPYTSVQNLCARIMQTLKSRHSPEWVGTLQGAFGELLQDFTPGATLARWGYGNSVCPHTLG